MLIGMGQKTAKENQTGRTVDSAFVFDAGIQDFEEKVIQASLTVPVLADFWAPWCGPCKQLTPVLEQLVQEAGGKVLLAKINIDDNPELAQALRIQSVPTVFAFFQGQPVTAFMGARPASEVKGLIDQLTALARQAQPDALDIPATLAQAADLMAEGRLAEAQDLYAAILAQDGTQAEAYAGLARTMMAAGDTGQARDLLNHAPETMASHPALAAARTALELAGNKADDHAVRTYEARLRTDENDHAARFDMAMALFAAGKVPDAMDALLEIMRRNRSWEEDKARLQLLKFFEALGPTDPQVAAGRRKLSSLLFS